MQLVYYKCFSTVVVLVSAWFPFHAFVFSVVYVCVVSRACLLRCRSFRCFGLLVLVFVCCVHINLFIFFRCSEWSKALGIEKRFIEILARFNCGT